MKYWAGLNPSADQELIRRGADELINRAMVFGFQLMRKDLTLEMKMLARSDLSATIFRLWLLCALFIWANVAPSPSSLDLACLNTCFVLILSSVLSWFKSLACRTLAVGGVCYPFVVVKNLVVSVSVISK
jgi:hypothetical protein